MYKLDLFSFHSLSLQFLCNVRIHIWPPFFCFTFVLRTKMTKKMYILQPKLLFLLCSVSHHHPTHTIYMPFSVSLYMKRNNADNQKTSVDPDLFTLCIFWMYLSFQNTACAETLDTRFPNLSIQAKDNVQTFPSILLPLADKKRRHLCSIKFKH